MATVSVWMVAMASSKDVGSGWAGVVKVLVQVEEVEGDDLYCVKGVVRRVMLPHGWTENDVMAGWPCCEKLG